MGRVRRLHVSPVGSVSLLGIAVVLAAAAFPHLADAQTEAMHACQVSRVEFAGWQGQQITNAWVKLIVVPQLGGRLMQVYFDGHPYLFVNPRYKGKYVPPAEAAKDHRWINYGGDKIWPMPEGSQDEHHWPGPISDPLDDGNYEFKVLSEGPLCKVRLEGPPDPKTGLQYSREITLASDSPEIRFHAAMKNIADHPIQWSMQSVTQYDTSDPQDAESYNHEVWVYTPVNLNSSYLESYHVRSGLADDPSFRIENGLFCLHWLPIENEVWLDSTAGWVAVVDASSQYGMIEKFQYVRSAEYPGKATVIFYKNGSTVQLNEQGLPELTSVHSENSPRYMEAELNSPIVPLAPGETYALDTEWHPVRMSQEPTSVTNAGVGTVVLRATRTAGGLSLRGSFGVFFSGQLEAQLFDSRGGRLASVMLQSVSPARAVELIQTIAAPAGVAEVSLHVIDSQSKDRGTLGTAKVSPEETSQK